MLSACTNIDQTFGTSYRNSVFSTQSVPKGYKYQDDTPLSTPAPSSPWIKYAVINDTENIGTQTAAWQGAVYELVDQMETNLPKDGTPLNLFSGHYSLMRGEKDNALDHYLRQVLIQKGYNLTTIPDAGLQIAYKADAVMDTKTKNTRTYNLSASILDKDGKASFTASIPAVLPE